jgi:transcriptional regulator with XRE-family HTH domain
MAPRRKSPGRRIELAGSSNSVSTLTATLTVSRPIQSIVARHVKALRTEQGLTQRQLAELVAQLGVKIDHSRIARVENGSASLDLVEAVAVAIALGVSLETLITPDEPNERVKVTPTIDVDRGQLHTWLVGQDAVEALIDQLNHLTHDLAALRPGYERLMKQEKARWRNPSPVISTPNYRARGQQEDHARIRQFERLEQEVGHLRDEALVLLENPLLPLPLLARLREAVNAVPLPARYTRHIVES